VFVDYWVCCYRGRFCEAGRSRGAGDDDEDGESLPSASGAAKPKGTEHQPFRALIEDVTGHKTASLRTEMANQPHVALVGVVQTMLVSVAFP